MSGLTVTGASVRLGSHNVLDGVGFAARAGAVTGLIGPNGAGKSTLLRAILGLVPLQAGSVLFDGEDLLAMSRRSRARLAALVEQTSSSDARLTVRDAVLLGRIPFQTVWQAMPSPVDLAVVEAALLAVDMADLSDRFYHTLSGGEQQRVQIARALAQQPRLLLLDEPTNHLDVHARLSTLELLRRHARTGATVLLALHDLNLAASFCDALVILQSGRPVAAGTPDQVLTPALLRAVYDVDATVLRHPANNRPLLAFGLPAKSMTPLD